MIDREIHFFPDKKREQGDNVPDKGTNWNLVALQYIQMKQVSIHEATRIPSGGMAESQFAAGGASALFGQQVFVYCFPKILLSTFRPQE